MEKEKLVKDIQRLPSIERNYRQFIELSQEGLWAVDVNKNTIFVNNAMADMLGYSSDEMIGKAMFQFIAEEERQTAEDAVKHQLGGIGERLESVLLRKDGSKIDVYVSASPMIDEKGAFEGAFAIITDITYRKKIESENERINDDNNNLIRELQGHKIGLEHTVELRTRQIKKNFEIQNIISSILAISLLPVSLEKQCKDILDIVMSIPWMQGQNKGSIFLSDDEKKLLRLIASHNFKDAQLSTCSTVPYGECLCGLAAIIKDIVFSTDSNADEHSIRYDDIMPHGHYCVPIVSADRLLGVINIYLSEGYKRNNEDEVFLKSIAGTIAGVVLRKETEDKIGQNYLIQSAINQILMVSLEPVSLKAQLQKVLDIISDVPWLLQKTTGCIFVVEDDPNVLVMKAQKGVSLDLYRACGHLPFGKCLCGRAAETGKTIFKTAIDDHHDITFENMHNHGHYCVPIISKDQVLGVINLYVPEGHTRTDLEDNFLSSVSSVLAGMIERKIADEKISHIANHDMLTGLPNRLLFSDRLNYEMRAMKRHGIQFALLYIDIDNFKEINEAVGHEAGDQILKEIARRLEGCIRETDTVARMGGDEFSIIASNLDTIADAEKIAEKIIALSNQPLETSKISFKTSMSIGISVYPSDAMDAVELLKNSELALYHSKKSGKNRYTFFNPEMDTMIHERRKLENELRQAIDNNELIVHYQPQIDIKNGRLIGAEALVRWQHPEKGLIPPFKFIPIAEETGLIIPLGERVLFNSCMQNSTWQKQGLPPITVAVNASLKQITKQYSFEDMLLQALYETELDPHHLEIEFTESFAMQNINATVRLLRKLNSMGVEVSIDDFGTGYSSLSYLKTLPFKKLKIDRSFIMEISSNQDDITIVKTIIDMAHNLRLKVIAEGVETIDQLEILRTLGCDEVQGYLFSKPVPADEFEQMLKEERIYYNGNGNGVKSSKDYAYL